MIWVQHDLYKNFLRSFNTGDINLSLDIFRSELSDLLTHKPNDFFSLLEKVKIKFNKKASYEEMLDIVLREMKVNEKFVRGLAFIIAQNNDVIKKNPKVSWVKLVDGVKKCIEQVADYFEQNPRNEKLFRKKTLEMVELKSSVIGDITRPINKKDNTVLWIFGLLAVGVAGYFVYRHFNKIKEDKLRAESLNGGSTKPDLTQAIPTQTQLQSQQAMGNGGNLGQNQVNKPIFEHINDPAYNVDESVLIPEAKFSQQNPQMNQQMQQNQVSSGIQIQVQPMQTNNNLKNNLINGQSVQQNNVNI
jgi:hypothetical protein